MQTALDLIPIISLFSNLQIVVYFTYNGFPFCWFAWDKSEYTSLNNNDLEFIVLKMK